MANLKIAANLENLDKIIAFIRTGIDATGFNKKQAYYITLASEEILSNIMKCAYPEKEGDVNIEYRQTKGKEGLKIIWMGFQDVQDKIMEFMTKHDINSSVGYDTRNLISSQYGIAYGAGLIAVDKEGIVQKKIPKGFSEDELIESLKVIIHGTGNEPSQ